MTGQAMGRTLANYKKLFDTIRRGDIRRFYFLYGPEEYLKKEIITELIKSVIPEANRAFNLDIFHGDDFDRNAFDDRMSSFPLFAENRLVILRRFDDLATANKDSVLSRVEKIPESLVFVAESVDEKLGNARAKALKKAAEAQGTAFQCKHLSEDETLERVRGRFKREGLDIEQDALELLVDSVGTQLSDLINEVEKIALNIGKSGVVTRDVVHDVVGRYRTENLFAILDLLGGSAGAGDFTRKLNRLIDGGEEPVFILAMLLRRVILLLQIKWLLEERGSASNSSQELAERMHMSTFYANLLKRQSSRFEKAELENLLDNLRWADLALKTSSVDPKFVLEEAFFASYVRKKLATTANIF